MMTRDATVGETKRAGNQSRRGLRVALGALALVAGLVCLALGGAVFSSAHDTHPVEIVGTIADYHEITINGAYARNELRLTGDPHTYSLDGRQFHPALPARFQKDARIQIWVDKGTINVLAITLYNELGINPTNYTTGGYDNPTLAFVATESEAAIIAAVGLALLIVGGLSVLLRRKRRATPRPGGLRGAPQPAPVAFGPGHAARPAMPPVYPASAPQPFVMPATAPGVNGVNGANGAVMPAVPLAQAAPTTPAPNRRPPPLTGAPDVGVDELPTQKTSAIPHKTPAASTLAGAVAGSQPFPGAPPAPPPPHPAQPGSVVVEAAASPFAAWGIAPQPQENGAQAHPVRPPALQAIVPPASEHPQASAPPGSLPDFPTERMPTTSGTTPPGDLSDEPTRKSETVAPPDPANPPGQGV